MAYNTRWAGACFPPLDKRQWLNHHKSSRLHYTIIVELPPPVIEQALHKLHATTKIQSVPETTKIKGFL